MTKYNHKYKATLGTKVIYDNNGMPIKVEVDTPTAEIKPLSPVIYTPEEQQAHYNKVMAEYYNDTHNTNDRDFNPTAADYVSLGANTLGAITTNLINRHALKHMKYQDAPIANQRVKLKTNYNINPQLDVIRESDSRYDRDVDANTSSSSVAINRRNANRINSILQRNALYANKENQETSLINQDRQNAQTIMNANINAHNQWEAGRAAFRNDILTKRADNNIDTINAFNAGIQDIISRNEKRKSERQTLIAQMAAHPNVNPRILKEMGVRGITKKMVRDWEKVHGAGTTRSGVEYTNTNNGGISNLIKDIFKIQ